MAAGLGLFGAATAPKSTGLATISQRPSYTGGLSAGSSAGQSIGWGGIGSFATRPAAAATAPAQTAANIAASNIGPPAPGLLATASAPSTITSGLSPSNLMGPPAPSGTGALSSGIASTPTILPTVLQPTTTASRGLGLGSVAGPRTLTPTTLGPTNISADTGAGATTSTVSAPGALPSNIAEFDSTQSGLTQLTEQTAQGPAYTQATSVALQNANPAYFSRVDPTTNLPVLDQTVIDKALGKRDSLGPQGFRDIAKDTGWGIQSDASKILRGAQALGLQPQIASVGMGTGQAGSSFEQLSSVATQLGIDPTQYTKTVTSSGGGMGARPTTSVVPDKNGLYNAINDATQDIYLVANALERTGLNKVTPHAAMVFRSDGRGNLVPITDAEGNPYVNYYKAVRTSAEGNFISSTLSDIGGALKGIASDLGPLTPILLNAALPGLGQALYSGISSATLGGALGTTAAGSAVTLGSVLGATGTAALTGATLNAGIAALTGGDIGKAAIVGAAGGAVAANATTIANSVLGADNVNKLAQLTNMSPARVSEIVAGGVSTGLASAVIDPNNIATNVIANVAGNFASNAAKNFVQDNLNVDNINLAGKSIGAATNVAVNAAIKGQDVAGALTRAAPGIAMSAASTGFTPIEERDITRGALPRNTAGYNQALEAFSQPTSEGVGRQLGSALAQADIGGVSAPLKVDISGSPILLETADLLTDELPPGTRLATSAEVDATNIRATQLANGQSAFLMPVGEQRPQYDYSVLANQAGAGALIGPYFGTNTELLPATTIAPNIPIYDTSALSGTQYGTIGGTGIQPWGVPGVSNVGALGGIKSLPPVEVIDTVDDIKSLPPVEVIGTLDDDDMKSLPPVEVIGTLDDDDMKSLPPVEVIGTPDEEPAFIGNQTFPLTPPPDDTVDTDTTTPPPELPFEIPRPQITNISSVYNAAEMPGGAPPGKPEATGLTSQITNEPFKGILRLQQLYPGIQNVHPALLEVMAQRMPPEGYYSYGQQSPLTQYGGALAQSESSGGETYTESYTPESGMPNSADAEEQPIGFADGGDVHVPQFITGKTGHYVEGEGDGQSDSIPAMLADGEYVFDADTVAALGNGSNKAGAAALDKMRESIRKHKRSASHKKIPPAAKSPLEYLRG
jgi:hypothetical protein